MTRKNNSHKPILLFLFMGFLILEISLRTFWSLRLSDVSILFYPLDAPKLGRVGSILPNAEFDGYKKYQPGELKSYYKERPHIHTSLIKINKYGFRGGDWEEKTNKLRVICLGESSTFGFMLRDSDTYPVQLEQQLKQKFKTENIEVLNMAVSESTLDWQNEMYEKEVLRFKPDIVIYYGGNNDVRNQFSWNWRGNSLRDRIFRSKLYKSPSLFLDSSRAFLNTKIVKGAGIKKLPQLDQIVDPISEKLSRLRQRVEKGGAKFIVVEQKILLSIQRENPSLTHLDAYQRILLEVKNERTSDLSFSDVIAFAQYPLQKKIESEGRNFISMDEKILRKEHFITPVHPSASGARIIADVITNSLEKMYPMQRSVAGRK